MMDRTTTTCPTNPPRSIGMANSARSKCGWMKRICGCTAAKGYYAEIADKPKNPFHAPDPATGAAMLRGTPEVSEIGFQLHLNPDGAVRTIPPPAPALRKRGASDQPQLTGPAQHYALDLTIKPSDIQF